MNTARPTLTLAEEPQERTHRWGTSSSRSPLLDRINGRKPAPIDDRTPEWRRRALEGKAKAADKTGWVTA